jgi:flagellar motility protein MotE (MotC chaperone)
MGTVIGLLVLFAFVLLVLVAVSFACYHAMRPANVRRRLELELVSLRQGIEHETQRIEVDATRRRAELEVSLAKESARIEAKRAGLQCELANERALLDEQVAKDRQQIAHLEERIAELRDRESETREQNGKRRSWLGLTSPDLQHDLAEPRRPDRTKGIKTSTHSTPNPNS